MFFWLRKSSQIKIPSRIHRYRLGCGNPLTLVPNVGRTRQTTPVLWKNNKRGPLLTAPHTSRYSALDLITASYFSGELRGRRSNFSSLPPSNLTVVLGSSWYEVIKILG